MHTLFIYIKIIILLEVSCLYKELVELRNDKFILVLGNRRLRTSKIFKSKYNSLNECPVKNCHFTNNEDLFEGNMTGFDAVIFSGRDLPDKVQFDRYAHQKYIYLNFDPSKDNPICNPNYDNYFNWTATYKLDSDFIFSHVIIKNVTGHTVGPRIEMNWIQNMQDVDEKLTKALETKKKAVAWFVSYCSLKHRNSYVYRLQKALHLYNLTVDIFGKCGNNQCYGNLSKCLSRLRTDYFFYLALERVEAVDFVTERIVPALQNFVVPIVHGGGDYSRFLPPGSYLNARDGSPETMAKKIHHVIIYRNEYLQFFKWRRYYRYRHASLHTGRYVGDGICNICKALNNKQEIRETPAKNHILTWWDSDFRNHCKKKNYPVEPKKYDLTLRGNNKIELAALKKFVSKVAAVLQSRLRLKPRTF